MKWIIASLPLWALGYLCMHAALIALRDVRRHSKIGQREMARGEAGMVLWGLFLAFVFFFAAAWVMG